MLTLLNKLSCKALVLDRIEDIACCGNFRKTCDLNRIGRTCLLNCLTLIVGHNSYTAHSRTCDDDIACVESTVLYQNSCDRTSALVKSCLNNSTLCKSVGVGFKLCDLCYQQNVFKQLVDSLTCLCGNGNADNIAAPFLGNKAVFCQLLLYVIGVCAGLIHLVDSNDNRHVRCLGMVDSLDSLGHDAVVRSNNKDSDISDRSTSCTH